MIGGDDRFPIHFGADFHLRNDEARMLSMSQSRTPLFCPSLAEAHLESFPAATNYSGAALQS